jgi:hypothetical protein
MQAIEKSIRYAPVSHPSGNTEAARFSVQAISPAFWIGIAGLLFAAALPFPTALFVSQDRSFLRSRSGSPTRSIPRQAD